MINFKILRKLIDKIDKGNQLIEEVEFFQKFQLNDKSLCNETCHQTKPLAIYDFGDDVAYMDCCKENIGVTKLHDFLLGEFKEYHLTLYDLFKLQSKVFNKKDDLIEDFELILHKDNTIGFYLLTNNFMKNLYQLNIAILNENKKLFLKTLKDDKFIREFFIYQEILKSTPSPFYYAAQQKEAYYFKKLLEYLPEEWISPAPYNKSSLKIMNFKEWYYYDGFGKNSDNVLKFLSKQSWRKELKLSRINLKNKELLNDSSIFNLVKESLSLLDINETSIFWRFDIDHSNEKDFLTFFNQHHFSLEEIFLALSSYSLDKNRIKQFYQKIDLLLKNQKVSLDWRMASISFRDLLKENLTDDQIQKLFYYERKNNFIEELKK